MLGNIDTSSLYDTCFFRNPRQINALDLKAIIYIYILNVIFTIKQTFLLHYISWCKTLSYHVISGRALGRSYVSVRL